jgi:hypothetical protein
MFLSATSLRIFGETLSRTIEGERVAEKNKFDGYIIGVESQY